MYIYIYLYTYIHIQLSKRAHRVAWPPMHLTHSLWDAIFIICTFTFPRLTFVFYHLLRCSVLLQSFSIWLAPPHTSAGESSCDLGFDFLVLLP